MATTQDLDFLCAGAGLVNRDKPEPPSRDSAMLRLLLESQLLLEKAMRKAKPCSI